MVKYLTPKNASYLKTITIDYCLKNDCFDLIINEAPFFKGNRRADLIMIKDEKLIGFEIKSELDTLKNLNNQIVDYNKIFDLVYVVIDKKFMHAKELKLLPKNVGIIVYTDDLCVKRKAKLIQRFKKEDLVSLLWRKDLEYLLGNKNLDFDKLQKIAQTKLTVNKIRAQILNSLKERYGANYKCFLLDRGNYTTIEDLRTITRIKHQTFLF